MIRALIIDLDNTIYPVSSIADVLFDRLFEHLENSGEDIHPQARHEITRRPFQWVAEKFGFSDKLTRNSLHLLRNLTYDKPMTPFEDYRHIRNIKIDKFLVTTGFSKLQRSKVKMLGIEGDFKAIHIVDPDISPRTKKHIFEELLQQYHYSNEDVLVIGDDPDSEIAAARALKIRTVLYDPAKKYPDGIADYHVTDHSEIEELLLV
jgi:putative hydrolase of the HAD superfamily